ncbi:MAG: anthranilate synthase component I family protein [Candidatus Moranbacteria bacterium]|nr:anthranilate synthase component I family protein [Candidatus Moranbacteria bacterium]
MSKIPKIKIENQKPNYIKFAEDIDFFKFFQKIENNFDCCYILESLGAEEDKSRYSVVGFDPENIIKGNGNILTIDDKDYITKNPYLELKSIIPQNIISRQYSGGLVGYLGYDCINYFEKCLNVKTHNKFDQFLFGVYKDGIVYDKMTGEIFYFYYKKNRLSLIKKIFKQKNTEKMNLTTGFVNDSKNRRQHYKMVKSVKREIINGNIFQAVIGFKSNYQIKGDEVMLYRELRKVNPSPFMYYLKFKDKKIIGASPELLFRLRQGEMETFPLAGTIKRGKNPQQDKKLARKLLNDKKEIAEHSMLIDLHRNDIGRVAQIGTVKVRNMMNIKKFSHVQHISSEVIGIIKKNQDMFTALSCNFPAGTLTGAPKIEAIKIIDDLEDEPRGPYGGGVGHFGFNGECTFAIPIRSLFIENENAFAQTAGGVVYDSVPEKEYIEIKNKLAAMKRVLNKFSK